MKKNYFDQIDAVTKAIEIINGRGATAKALESISMTGAATKAMESMNMNSATAKALESISMTGATAKALESISRNLSFECAFKVAERQAASISSLIDIPDTQQALIEQITKAKEISLNDKNYSTKDLYDTSVAVLTKSMSDIMPDEDLSDGDNDSEPSQLLIGAALNVVSDFIDGDPANDSFFGDSVIEAEYLFSVSIDAGDDSPDEIIEAFCKWIQDYSDSIKDDMTPVASFQIILALVLFVLAVGIGLKF